MGGHNLLILRVIHLVSAKALQKFEMQIIAVIQKKIENFENMVLGKITIEIKKPSIKLSFFNC